MKKILILITIISFTFSCREDDLDVPAVGYYPIEVENALEGDPTIHTIALQASGELASDAIVKITVTNGESLSTVPPMANGVISMIMPRGTRDVSFEVVVGSDNKLENYISTFKISSVEGGIKGVLPADEFTLFVVDPSASSVDLSLPFSDDFENCVDAGDFNIPENWIEAFVTGSKTDRGWGCRAFGNNGSQGVRASAFAGDAGTDDAWLISNGRFDLTTLSSAELKFWIESRFAGPGAITVHWSTDYTGSGDPLAATWTEVADATTQILGITHETFSEITVSLNAATGNNIHLAFRYAGGTDAESIAYTIDDLTLTGN